MLSYARRGKSALPAAAALAALLSAPLVASTSSENDIRMQAVDAQLTLVLTTVAGSAGLDPRLSSVVLNSDERVSDTLIGDSEEALHKLAERFDLTLHVEEGIAWIDSVEEQHTLTMEFTPDIAEEVYRRLLLTELEDAGHLQQLGGRLDVTGSRPYVKAMAHRANDLVDQIKVESAAVEIANAATSQEISRPARKAVEPLAAHRKPMERDSSPFSSISDVPGFNTEYID